MPRVTADLEVSLLRDDRTVATAHVVSDGRHVVVRSDDLDVLAGGRSGGELRALADALADHDLVLSVEDGSGAIMRLGAVKPRFWHRVATGSAHVQVARWRPAAALKAQALTGSGGTVGPPPAVAWPDLPTAPWSRRRTTTTHDPYGGGHPRLYLSDTRVSSVGRGVRVHALALGETVIGTAEECDLQLDGMSEIQAVVRRTADDEYEIVARGRVTPSYVNGRELPEQTLHTGSRIELGPWRLVYVRDEFADHGRPYGGRIGGELGRQRAQDAPRYQR